MSKQNDEFYQRSESKVPISIPQINRTKRITRASSCHQSGGTYSMQPHSQKLVYQGQHKEKSVHDFDKTIINTCNFVDVINPDNYKAHPFYTKPIERRNPSQEVKSVSHTHYGLPNYQWVSCNDKKLARYEPYSQRNRFIDKDYVYKYYNNRSIVEFGKRQSNSEKMNGFCTTYKKQYEGLNLRTNLNNKNQGISAYWHKWQKRNKL